jgi:hypothetical protein
MHNAKAFAAISHLTVGGFRDWLLSDDATQNVLGGAAPGVTPEMAAAMYTRLATARGEGCRVIDDSGREYIESVAGLWCASRISIEFGIEVTLYSPQQPASAASPDP